jgi:hypothetical protein
MVHCASCQLSPVHNAVRGHRQRRKDNGV